MKTLVLVILLAMVVLIVPVHGQTHIENATQYMNIAEQKYQEAQAEGMSWSSIVKFAASNYYMSKANYELGLASIELNSCPALFTPTPYPTPKPYVGVTQSMKGKGK
jgi:hypothetical protein